MTHYSDAGLVTLAEGVHAFIGEGGDSNAGAFLTPEGWIVLDAQQHVCLAEKFRAALEATGERSFYCLALTHYHLDHSAGGSVFASDAPVLAHEITLEKFHEVLGAGVSSGDSFTDFETKVTCMFGPNITEFSPTSTSSLPERDGFRFVMGCASGAAGEGSRGRRPASQAQAPAPASRPASASRRRGACVRRAMNAPAPGRWKPDIENPCKRAVFQFVSVRCGLPYAPGMSERDERGDAHGQERRNLFAHAPGDGAMIRQARPGMRRGLILLVSVLIACCGWWIPDETRGK